MKCPYCDENIHLMAKFCPKCGLPLNEDATLMGASTPLAGLASNRWVLGGGAAAIVVLALGIGFAASRNGGTRGETVSRQPVGRYVAPTAPSGLPGMYTTPLNQYPVTAARPPVTSNARARWAYTPPPQTARRVMPTYSPQPPRPESPRHVLTMNPNRPRQAPTVRVVQTPVAPLPPPVAFYTPPVSGVRGSVPGGAPTALPTFTGSGFMGGGLTARAAEGTVLNNLGPNAGGPNGFGPVDNTQFGPDPQIVDREGYIAPDRRPVASAMDPESQSLYVWDPVQERYAVRGDRAPRRLPVATGGFGPGGFVPGLFDPRLRR